MFGAGSAGDCGEYSCSMIPILSRRLGGKWIIALAAVYLTEHRAEKHNPFRFVAIDKSPGSPLSRRRVLRDLGFTRERDAASGG
jgi:hypothetical protein